MDNWINTYQRLDIYKYVKIALPAIVGGLSVGEYHHNLFTYLSSTYIKYRKMKQRDYRPAFAAAATEMFL